MMRPDCKQVENINEKCRPSNIALSYNNLESQEWVDAKECLEDMGFDNEETMIKFLCAVVMVMFYLCYCFLFYLSFLPVLFCLSVSRLF